MTAVADAIRTKAGGSDPLSFPDGFVTAVGGITTGGGSSDPADNEWAAMICRPDTGVDIREEDWLSIAVANFAFRKYAFAYNKGYVEIPMNYMVPTGGFRGFEGEVVFIDSERYHNLCSEAFKSAHLKRWPVGLNHFLSNIAPSYLFQDCRFEEDVELPEGITRIESGFMTDVYKQSLDQSSAGSITITIPESVTSFGANYAIAGYYIRPANLIMRSSTPPTLDSSSSLLRINKITVPAGSLQAYQEATNWSQFADIMVEASA